MNLAIWAVLATQNSTCFYSICISDTILLIWWYFPNCHTTSRKLFLHFKVKYDVLGLSVTVEWGWVRIGVMLMESIVINGGMLPLIISSKANLPDIQIREYLTHRGPMTYMRISVHMFKWYLVAYYIRRGHLYNGNYTIIQRCWYIFSKTSWNNIENSLQSHMFSFQNIPSGFEERWVIHTGYTLGHPVQITYYYLTHWGLLRIYASVN